MGESEMDVLLQGLLESVKSGMAWQEQNLQNHAAMHWPKLLPLMHMHCSSITSQEYGSVFAMSTHVNGGMMDLATIVCTPFVGSDIPVLLIDIMKMKQKQAVFVEYYDCTEHGAEVPLLQKVKTDYNSLLEYDEKPAWYIQERMNCSLIKGGSDWNRLKEMALASMKAYQKEIAAHPLKENAAVNQQKLSHFIDRMVKEGNPSEKVMNRVLGNQEAEHFFRTVIMPAGPQEKGEKI